MTARELAERHLHNVVRRLLQVLSEEDPRMAMAELSVAFAHVCVANDLPSEEQIATFTRCVRETIKGTRQ